MIVPGITPAALLAAMNALEDLLVDAAVNGHRTTGDVVTFKPGTDPVALDIRQITTAMFLAAAAEAD